MSEPSSWKRLNAHSATGINLIGTPSPGGGVPALPCAGGRLSKVVINTPGTSTSTLTMYDGLDNTGAVIGVLDCSVGPPRDIKYMIVLSIGLFVVFNGSGTAADILIGYK